MVVFFTDRCQAQFGLFFSGQIKYIVSAAHLNGHIVPCSVSVGRGTLEFSFV
jgi:hypothetical protein